MHITPKQKAKPQLSANQFAEYLHATAVRRRGILKTAKYQNTPAPVRYQYARQSIARYFRNGDMGVLYKTVEYLTTELEQHQVGVKILNEFALSDHSLSLEAMNRFITSLNAFSIPPSKMTLGDSHPNKLDIAGVLISVRPDVIIQSKHKTKGDTAGGLLLSFSKEPKRNEFGVTAATLVHMYAEQEFSPASYPDPKICFSLDVFGQTLTPTPVSSKARKTNMVAACEEIAVLWPTI